ncbi:MAG: glycosyltransferase [Acidimicrobiia bacterium]|nr:glycosyltransferase [Acidimicrobiia bacterium]
MTNLVWWLLATAEAAALIAVAPRLWRAARGAQRLVAGGDDDAVVISVVIPARDEAARLAECLSPLRDAPGVLEVIVVDDESTDATAAIAEQHGALVVRGAALRRNTMH